MLGAVASPDIRIRDAGASDDDSAGANGPLAARDFGKALVTALSKG
ncbi:MAG TPA: hypothetical protein VJ386_09470 [Candidatus Deferrimicrobiaceae bacterium]|nr:hypothetical protein [Candidatus Deferrimicrobiaceae bacterium]